MTCLTTPRLPAIRLTTKHPPTPRLALAAVVLCACADVPALTFAQADAAPDAPLDASAAGLDAGPACVQPDDAAPAPYVCCGSIACEGLCAGNCDLCASRCTDPETFCCAKNNNVICLPLTSACH
jgi:hypothetical protein